MKTAKRKTKDPCPGCALHKDLCICAHIPILALKTKVSMIIHYRELRRTTNTGSLALKALSNSELRVRGLSRDRLDLSDLLSPDYQSLLFYPADEALELTDNFVQSIKKPIQLIVPDGNWRQASKIQTRHPELSHLPRVMIKTANPMTTFLRKETRPEGMATLQAIAAALGVIEGAEVRDQLMAIYKLKLDRTLIGRGTTRPTANTPH